MSTSADLTGKIAVVTGSSRGIGAAVARELASAGADVFVCGATSVDACRSVADSVEIAGRRAETFLGDLRQPETQDELIQRAFAWQGRVDVWVNNAGVDLLTGAGAAWDFDTKLAALWQVDVAATIRLSRLVGAKMAAADGGQIVNVVWDQADSGMEGDSGQLFAAAKAAVMAFSKSLAASLAPAVRVHCVAPGWIQTAWGRDAPELWQRRAVRESQLARWGQPEDVARAVRFLVSPAAGFLTGQVLAVNGGFRFAAPDDREAKRR